MAAGLSTSSSSSSFAPRSSLRAEQARSAAAELSSSPSRSSPLRLGSLAGNDAAAGTGRSLAAGGSDSPRAYLINGDRPGPAFNDDDNRRQLHGTSPPRRAFEDSLNAGFDDLLREAIADVDTYFNVPERQSPERMNAGKPGAAAHQAALPSPPAADVRNTVWGQSKLPIPEIDNSSTYLPNAKRALDDHSNFGTEAPRPIHNGERRPANSHSPSPDRFEPLLGGYDGYDGRPESQREAPAVDFSAASPSARPYGGASRGERPRVGDAARVGVPRDWQRESATKQSKLSTAAISPLSPLPQPDSDGLFGRRTTRSRKTSGSNPRRSIHGWAANHQPYQRAADGSPRSPDADPGNMADCDPLSDLGSGSVSSIDLSSPLRIHGNEVDAFDGEVKNRRDRAEASGRPIVYQHNPISSDKPVSPPLPFGLSDDRLKKNPTSRLPYPMASTTRPLSAQSSREFDAENYTPDLRTYRSIGSLPDEPNNRVVVSALRTLQEKITRLEGEKRNAKERIADLEQDLSRTRQLLLLERNSQSQSPARHSASQSTAKATSSPTLPEVWSPPEPTPGPLAPKRHATADAVDEKKSAFQTEAASSTFARNQGPLPQEERAPSVSRPAQVDVSSSSAMRPQDPPPSVVGMDNKPPPEAASTERAPATSFNQSTSGREGGHRRRDAATSVSNSLILQSLGDEEEVGGLADIDRLREEQPQFVAKRAAGFDRVTDDPRPTEGSGSEAKPGTSGSAGRTDTHGDDGASRAALFADTALIDLEATIREKLGS
ncbi:hypothetical protein DFJ73DRAFT_140557 [Zopfochytrium polystomum]|nr:hypothetical protein DFJ73DRAFT_140557 [Zopfochytrium polystomum]